MGFEKERKMQRMLLLRSTGVHIMIFDLFNSIRKNWFCGWSQSNLLQGDPNFFLHFFFENLFSRCVQWLETRFSLGRSESRRSFLLFQHLQSLRDPAVSLSSREFAHLEQEMWKFPIMFTEICLEVLENCYFVCLLIKI